MQKDFITVTPDSGTGNATITVAVEQNSGDARTIQLTISGAGMNRTMNVSQADNSYDPATAPIGVYIVHTNGKVYPRANWKTSENSKAVGVGVKTSKCSFIIAPVEQASIQWGGSGTLISSCTSTTSFATAQTDYNGKVNTDAIVSQLGATAEYAARYCRNYVFKNGAVGYLPASGELYEASQNKSEVDACMSLIGGKLLYDSSIKNSSKWSSTQYGAYDAWLLNWSYNNVYNYGKAESFSYYCARPFAALL